MNPITVNYDDHRLWGQPNLQDNRPYAEIILHGKTTTQFERIWALIDTGADFIQVNNAIAQRIGIDLTKDGKPKQIQTAGGGQITVTEVGNVEVEVEGKRIRVNCLFGQNQTPIFGRVAILAAMDIGFDLRGWLLKK